MINQDLLRLYKQARDNSLKHRERVIPAPHALELAKVRLEIGKRAYSDHWPWQRGAGNVSHQPRRPFPHSRERYAWIENTQNAGLRFVGFADEIVTGRAIDHKGWYIDEYQDDVYRGAVWQFPARKGVAQYVAGYVDPHNKGAAFVCLDIVPGEKIDSSYDAQDDARDAAFQADSIAQRYAEKEREYQEQWQQGAQWSELGDSIAEKRRELLALLREFRPLRKAGEIQAPALCAQLRSDIESLIEEMTEAREKRESIFDEWCSTPGFADHLPREV